MISRTLGAALDGLDALLVQVEVDVSGGLPAVTVVGLPDAAAEALKKIRSEEAGK